MTQAAPAAPPRSRATLWQWLRHHVASVVATAVDYGVMIACVELAHVAPVPATAIGALAGGASNFALGRAFTYHAESEPLGGQAWRYALVSGGSLALNAGGEALFHNVLGLQYLLARVITSVVVSNAWNYPLQRFFVFSRRPSP
ncbi:MAG TPA: GtrA family protein [Polyangia bacterium]|nr:GtrA family protein [Polyangia bacterium]